MNETDLLSFRWTGDDPPYIDAPTVRRCGDLVIGCYGGGSAAGAFKNEDAAFVLARADRDWCFAALLDGHYSLESDALILRTLAEREARLIEAMSLPAGTAVEAVRSLLVEAFSSREFRQACRGVTGEASALFCAQRGRFVFWLSVGDCLAFAFHPELAGLGQFAMNQRHFYEWLGKSNVFDLEAPAFSSGVQELRTGLNTIVMITDGLYEYAGSPFEDPAAIYRALGPAQPDLESAVLQAMQAVHKGSGRDSATVIAWQVVAREAATRSSPQPR